MIEGRAPGKLVLCGEYAVLHGASAIAVAVGAEAVATLEPAADSQLRVAGGGEWPFAWRGGLPSWRQVPPGGQGAVLEAVARALAARGFDLPPVTVTLDSRAFSARLPDGAVEKLGLGSSAAIVVALVRAALALADRADDDAILAIALEAHRDLQGGGSGIDVATAALGGVVALHPSDDGPRAESLAWPAGLAALAVWTGQGASTPAMLAKLEAWRRAEPRLFTDRIDALRDVAAGCLDAWRESAVSRLVAALAGYATQLRLLDAAARIGIFTPLHHALSRESASAGCVYKTSGAGGGDFGLAFAAAPAAVEALGRRWRAEGRLVLPIRP
ncbi:MAG: hypothetical protein FJ197_00495 [Gammaproteobacteria bacterium]|nr:hypothetical protein [Gammaproteobacteria bacterium]